MAGGAVRGGNPGGSFPALRASERNPSDCFLSTGSYGNRDSVTAKVFGEGGMGLSLIHIFLHYDIKSKGSEAYLSLAKEIVMRKPGSRTAKAE